MRKSLSVGVFAAIGPLKYYMITLSVLMMRNCCKNCTCSSYMFACVSTRPASTLATDRLVEKRQCQCQQPIILPAPKKKNNVIGQN